MMFIPSNIKITKTKLYSGDLRIEYNNHYQNSASSTGQSELCFKVNFIGPELKVELAEHMAEGA